MPIDMGRVAETTTLFDLPSGCLHLILRHVVAFGPMDPTIIRLTSVGRGVADLFRKELVFILEPECPHHRMRSLMEAGGGARALKTMCIEVQLPSNGKAAALMERLKPLCARNPSSGLSQYFEKRRGCWVREQQLQKEEEEEEDDVFWVDVRRKVHKMSEDIASLRLDVDALQQDSLAFRLDVDALQQDSLAFRLDIDALRQDSLR
jgi:hypothetical protein